MPALGERVGGILEGKAEVDAHDEERSTPLIRASVNDQTDAVRVLLDLPVQAIPGNTGLPFFNILFMN